MHDVYFTLGAWRVKPGRESDFIAAWKGLGETFAGLPHPPGAGTLLQSMAEPHLFYSFGPWQRLQDIEEMRDDPGARAGIQRLRDLCSEATPGAFRVVAEMPARKT